MQECIDLVNRIELFAIDDYIMGVDFKDRTNLMPFGLHFAQWEPIDSIDLKSPTSLVDSKVM